METASKFQQFFMFMGPWKWPLIFLSFLVFILICIKVYDYFIAKQPTSRYLGAILFWGSISAITGIIGQVSGLWAALSAIMDAPDISPPIVLMGFLTSFVTTMFGFIIMAIAALCWWALKYKYSILSNKQE